MKVAVVIQARTGSTRLPGKVLLPLAGAPLLVRLVERVRAARTPFELVVATTGTSEDDAVRLLCRAHGLRCYSGHPTDLIDRHLGAASSVGADVCVKIPSDCPLIDPAVIDRVLSLYLAAPERFDFVSNLHPATYPDGQDVEVMPMPMLRLAHQEATRRHEREHTTPFFWDRPHRFRIGNVRWETGLDYSMSHRLTIDYPEDYALISAIYERLYEPTRPVFSLAAILSLLEREPALFALNQRFAGVNWYRHHLGELATVSSAHTRAVEDRRP